MNNRPPVWQMIKEAVEHLGGRATNKDIINYIKERYGDVNEDTIRAQIRYCTVNLPSRIWGPENQKPRKANQKYDFLFKTEGGVVELYDPAKHGEWEIRRNKNGDWEIAKVDELVEFAEQLTEEQSENENWKCSILEDHLRDIIVRNLEKLKIGDWNLELYVDDSKRIGVEYSTDVGRIYILAIDDNENFVVIELKVNTASDNVIGQLLRYIGWVKKNLSNGKKVDGIIIADQIDDKLRYAALNVPEVSLYEYDLKINFNSVNKL